MADERTEKQKVQEITDKLEEGLKELFESEKYKTWKRCLWWDSLVQESDSWIGYPGADGPILKNSVSIFFTDMFIDLWYNQFKRLNKGDGYTMNLFCEEIHKL